MYLVIEMFEDGEAVESYITYLTADKDKAEDVCKKSIEKNMKILEKAKKDYEQLNERDFEELTQLEKDLYSDSAAIVFAGWFSTKLKSVDTDTPISVYI